MASILIVDDEPGVREFMRDALADQGHQLLEAADGAAALACLEERPYQLMILDLRLPGVDGMDVLRQARARYPGTNVVVSTAHGGIPDAVEAMKLGAFDFIQKPIRGPDALRRLADRALRWGPPVAPTSGTGGGASAPALASSRLGLFVGELRRRRVYRVAAAYLAGGFLVLQGAQLILPALPAPSWTYALLVGVTLLGLPVAAVLGWIYDIEDTGVRRTEDRSAGGDRR